MVQSVNTAQPDKWWQIAIVDHGGIVRINLQAPIGPTPEPALPLPDRIEHKDPQP